jgi:thiol-disulfide isomerase/thioredoxin
MIRDVFLTRTLSSITFKLENPTMKMKQLLLIAMLCLLNSAFTNAQNKPEPVTIQGQVVCSMCWFEADRTTTPFGTPHEIECARECAEKGIPSAVAVPEGDDFKLYLLQEGRVKQEKWLEQIANQIQVSGRVHRHEDKDYITVDELKPIPDNTSQNSSPSDAELVLRDLLGVEQRVSAYRGRIVVLNFWATWCKPCRQEMPDLAAIQNEYAALGVQVIGAAADKDQDRAKVMQFIEETGVNFPVWLGATVQDLGRFGLGPALPGTVILDREGRILRCVWHLRRSAATNWRDKHFPDTPFLNADYL